MKKAKNASRKRRIRGEVEFVLGKNETLGVSFSILGPGIDRVFVTNEGGKVKVHANAASGSHFLFHKGKTGSYHCDYWIENPSPAGAIEDILHGKFWGQFNWGQLAVYVKDRKFNRTINRRIKQLVEKFMSQAAKELNGIKRPPRRGK